ncbi:uncharacterized protein LOC130668495 [Microplitis mediator]|uniref:uncharacterized protein LOC130668495 n=1 Tax=Microplitis mediator TaxID=375433 RepID=UPI002557A2F1|nr:uncharacterized protein LOC130668495 [Microplitis mediator]
MGIIDSNSNQTITTGYETSDPALNFTFENDTTFDEIGIIDENSNQTTSSGYGTCKDSLDDIFSDEVVLEAGGIIDESDSSDSEKVDEWINKIKQRQMSIKKSSKTINQPSNSTPVSVKKFVWGYDITNALVESYSYHHDWYGNPLLRKILWENITNDLVSQKFDVTAEMCESKWKSLLVTYKGCKDGTGRGPTRFKFFEAIDEIEGHRPINSKSFTISATKLKNKSVETKNVIEPLKKNQKTISDSEKNKKEKTKYKRKRSADN